MTITNDNYEALLFQYAEGLLSQEDRRAVEAWLSSHPEAAEELTLFSDTPNLELPPVPMPGKESLHRKAATFIPFWHYAAAASIALLIGILVWLHPAPAEEKTVMVAEKHAPATQPIVPQSVTPLPAEHSASTVIRKPSRTQTSPLPSVEERPAVAEVPIVQPLPEEETVVILYEEILTPCVDDEPILAQVEIDSSYSPTLLDRLEDFGNLYTNHLYEKFLLARAEMDSRLSRRPF